MLESIFLQLLFILLLAASSEILFLLADKNNRGGHHCLSHCGGSNSWVNDGKGSEYRAFLFPPTGSGGSYFEALARCNRLDATLAVITSAEENAFVSKFVASAYVLEKGNVSQPTSQPTLWIGMHRLRGNPITYFTDTGVPWGFGRANTVMTPGGNTTAPWLPGQPSGNATYTPSCVHMVSEEPTRNWASFACRLSLAGYICERKCSSPAEEEECRHR